MPVVEGYRMRKLSCLLLLLLSGIIFPDGSSFVNNFSNESVAPMYAEVPVDSKQPEIYADPYAGDMFNGVEIAGIVAGSVAGASALVGAGKWMTRKFKEQSARNRQRRALQEEQAAASELALGSHISAFCSRFSQCCCYVIAKPSIS